MSTVLLNRFVCRVVVLSDNLSVKDEASFCHDDFVNVMVQVCVWCMTCTE